MKTIIKVLYLTLIVVVFGQCKKEPASINIQDNNFLKALIDIGVDKNGDGIISPGEAAEVTFLDVSGCSLSNLKGIEAFVNLDTLYCSRNSLTYLDLFYNHELVPNCIN